MRAAICSLLVNVFMRGFVEFGGRSQRTVVVNNIFLAVVDVLQIILFEKGEPVFRGFQIIGAGEFAVNWIGAGLRKRRDRDPAAGSEAGLVITLRVSTLNNLIVAIR